MAPTAAPINPMLDQLDFFAHPRPFKNPNYKAPIRRNKNLKQILSETTRSSGTSTPLPTDPNRLNNVPTSMPTEGSSASGNSSNGNGIITLALTTTIVGKKNVPLMQPTYQNIESAPSLRRGNKWCDITGLPAKYTDPKSKLRYADGEVYKVLRSLPAGGAEGYLEVRAANVILK